MEPTDKTVGRRFPVCASAPRWRRVMCCSWSALFLCVLTAHPAGAIVNSATGQPAPANYVDPQVGVVGRDVDPWACSGTVVEANSPLLANHIVLTARHCLSPTRAEFFTLPELPVTYHGLGIVHPTIAAGVPDLGLILTEELIPVAPVALAEATPAPGANVEIAGFGHTMTRQLGTALYLTASATTIQTYAAPHVIQFGDSGGPTFVGQGSNRRLLATHSASDGLVMWDTRADSRRDWVRGSSINSYAGAPSSAVWDPLDSDASAGWVLGGFGVDEIVNLNDHNRQLVVTPQNSFRGGTTPIAGLLNNETLVFGHSTQLFGPGNQTAATAPGTLGTSYGIPLAAEVTANGSHNGALGDIRVHGVCWRTYSLNNRGAITIRPTDQETCVDSAGASCFLDGYVRVNGALTNEGTITTTQLTYTNSGVAPGTTRKGGLVVGAEFWNRGLLINNGSVAIGSPLQTLAGGEVRGDGIVTGPMTFSGGTLSPGSSIGRLTNVGATTFDAGGHYRVELSDFAGAAGQSRGWDVLDVSAGLNITATASAPFIIDVLTLLPSKQTAGPAANFDSSVAYEFPIVQLSGGSIAGFNPVAFQINVAEVQNNLDGGTWSIVATSNDLRLRFDPWLPGDANGDGVVGVEDYETWLSNLGNASGTTDFSVGDFTGDRRVTAADYSVWADQFAAQTVGQQRSAELSVPEPASLGLTVWAALAAPVLLRRRRSVM